jgi:hypothetical protein
MSRCLPVSPPPPHFISSLSPSQLSLPLSSLSHHPIFPLSPYHLYPMSLFYMSSYQYFPPLWFPLCIPSISSSILTTLSFPFISLYTSPTLSLVFSFSALISYTLSHSRRLSCYVSPVSLPLQLDSFVSPPMSVPSVSSPLPLVL